MSDPENPTEIVNFTGCVQGTTTGNQGDVIVWGDILVRSWNSPAPAGGAVGGGVAAPTGQEGLLIFDISNPAAPVGLTFVPTPCGSHTATGVPDLANGRLLVYNSSSSGATGCRGIDIVQVPLANPSAASYLRFEASGDPGPHLVTVNPLPPRLGPISPRAPPSVPRPALRVSPAPPARQRRRGRVPDRRLRTLHPGGRRDRARRPRQLRVPAQDTERTERRRRRGRGCQQRRRTPTTMGGTNPAIVIPAVMVSLDDGTTIKAGLPATGRVHSPATPDRSCHDTGVILGEAMTVACAGGNGFSVWTIDPAEGGSLIDPKLLYSRTLAGVSIGHTASFSWDGKVLIFGHEPGGGGEARCQATSAEVDRTLFFIDAATGDTLGTIIHPRPQSATENCTWHNLDVVPTDKRYVLVAGNYQSGISVVDFTDPANATEIAYADPAPLVHPTNPNAVVGGGDWSSYWYDGRSTSPT